jgi:REP element-mobilizing transposase RayT
MNMTRDPHPKFDPNKHHRKSIRLQGYDYSQAGAYFVTMVVQGRECLFGEIVNGEMHLNEYGEIVQKWWNEIPIHFPNVELGAFVIMSNHVHGIIWIIDNRRGEVLSPRYNPNNNILNENVDGISTQGGETPPLRKRTLGQIVAYFKYQSTKEMNHIETENAITKFWQRNYYEHIIRNEPPPSLPQIRLGFVVFGGGARQGGGGGDTSKPTPPNGTMTTRIHQIIGGKIHSTITPSALSGISPQGGRKVKTMFNDLIKYQQKNKVKNTQLNLTNTSPSPFRGKLEGGS